MISGRDHLRQSDVNAQIAEDINCARISHRLGHRLVQFVELSGRTELAGNLQLVPSSLSAESRLTDRKPAGWFEAGR